MFPKSFAGLNCTRLVILNMSNRHNKPSLEPAVRVRESRSGSMDSY